MTKQAGVWGRIRKLLLVCALSLSLSLSPGKAEAAYPVFDVLSYAQLVEMASTLGSMLSTISNGYARLTDGIGHTGLAVVTSLQMILDANKRATQAEIDAAYHLTNIERNAEIAAKDPPNKAADRALCKKIQAGQSRAYSHQARLNTGGKLYKGWLDDSRNFRDGKGPDYIRNIVAYRCAVDPATSSSGFMNPKDVGTGTTMAKCAASKPKFIDADISIETILPSIGKEPLEEPSDAASGNGVTPDLSDDAQVLYVAARNLCYNSAGPTVRPPFQKELETMEGQRRTALYSSCMPSKSAFVDQCFKMLAYVSRPDCSSNANQEECRTHHKRCQEALRNKVNLPASFGNCDASTGEGLSPYQMDWLDAMECNSPGELLTKKGDSRSSSDLMTDSERCSSARILFEQSVQQRISNLTASLSAIYLTRGCFEEMKR